MVGVVGAAGVGGAALDEVDVGGVDGPRGTPFEHAAVMPRPRHNVESLDHLAVMNVLYGLAIFSGTRSPVERMPAWKPLSARYRSYCSVSAAPSGRNHQGRFGAISTRPE
jgi:hypothetical protein